jgi:signal transduction histidine kinase
MLRAAANMQPAARRRALGWTCGETTRYLRDMSKIAQPTADPDCDRARASAPLWVLILAAWLIPALLSGFDTYMQSRLEGRPPEWRWVLFNAIDWLLYAVLTPLVFWASRRWPLMQPHLARHITLHAAGALSMCVAWAGLGTLLRLEIFPTPAHLTFHKLLVGFVSWTFTTLPFGVGVYFALVGIEHSFFYLAQARERETQAAYLAAQLAEAQLSALRMQFNPHFLFNSLNAILVLVRDQNTAAAERMLELRSDVLHQVLRSEAAHETTLSAEVEFWERYLAIEQIRFSDRLRPRIDMDPALCGAGVPRFLLQPLVENALRHGIARRTEAGFLQIGARREGAQLVLTVRDDGPGMPSAFDAGTAPLRGVGVANTRARLAALYGANATLEVKNAEGGGVIATVRLPYHEARGHD